ncbi:MAG: response regulator transcription factor [Desulfobacterales bacterium]
MKNKHRVMIAEDHDIVRQALRYMITNRFKEVDVVAEAKDGLEAIKFIRKYHPDILVLDISMPKLDGFSVIDAIRHFSENIKIIILTIHKNEEYIRTAFKYGINAYCLKSSSFDELAMAIRMTLSGKRFITPEISKNVLNGYLENADDIEKVKEKTIWDNISQREREVLKLVGEGYKNREIADYLCISLKTVEKHRSNIMKKLNMHTSSALAAYAAKKNLVTF